MHVLITCAGRRNLLVRYFREALQGRGLVYAADREAIASALQEADASFLVPSIEEPQYVDHLVRLCHEFQIGLLLSINDLELPLLSRHRQRFVEHGTIPVISSPEVIDICFDKWQMGEFLRQAGVDSPRTCCSLDSARAALARGDIAFPLVLKPRWGTASLGVEYVTDADDLELAYRFGRARIMRSVLSGVSGTDADHALLIQERIRGQEYGLDVVNDLNGRYVATFVKRKLSHSMRADGVGHAVTVADAKLEALGARLGGLLGHVGNMDCDVFIADDRCYVLDLNPRFGGGYPFSHAAGANLPAALLAWAKGRNADPAWLRVRAGIAAARFDALVTMATAPIAYSSETPAA